MPQHTTSPVAGYLWTVILVALFLVWFVRQSNRRRRSGWAPLAAVVQGHTRGTHMVGTYEGRGVIARSGPTSDSPRSPRNAQAWFSVALDTIPRRTEREQRRGYARPAGGADWAVQYGPERASDALRGREGWYVTTESEPVRQALAGMNVTEELAAWGTYPTLTYDRQSKMVAVTEDLIESMTPERFRSRLAFLARMVQLNEHTNGSAMSS